MLITIYAQFNTGAIHAMIMVLVTQPYHMGLGLSSKRAMLEGCYNTVYNTTVQRRLESSDQWYAMR